MKTKEQIAAYNKQYREQNKEKLSAYATSWRSKNKDKHRANQRRYWHAHKAELVVRYRESDNHNHRALRHRKPANYLIIHARHRAKKHGFEFNITIDDVVVPLVCPVFNIPLIPGKRSDNSPSLDRIDSSKGYVKGNVRVISWKANRLKNNATTEELKLLYEDLQRLQYPG